MTHPKQKNNPKTALGSLSRLSHAPHVLMLVETSRAFGRRVVEGVSRYSLENGPWLVHFEEGGVSDISLEWVRKWRGDGIIIRSVNLKISNYLMSTKLPLVELRGDEKIGHAHVRTDFTIGAQKIFDHFHERGLREFAHFTYGANWWTDSQSQAFRAIVEQNGYRCRSFDCFPSIDPQYEWREKYRSRVSKWLRSLPRPIGIHASADQHAVRLLEICRELNIHVPEEMAILGVGNDLIICENVRPTLSSLDLDARRIGYEAAKLLDEKMAGKKTGDEPICIPPSQVIVRQSTDHIAIPDADVIQAMQFIRAASCKGINVDRVAEEVGLSRRGLERRFQRLLGTTPKEEIMRVRLDYAKNLLAQTDRTIESIAARCSFASLAYFSRAFRREVGMTANAFRKKSRISRNLSDSAE
jgi:LacI family transcriptional regulator